MRKSSPPRPKPRPAPDAKPPAQSQLSPDARRELQEKLLGQISDGAALCAEIERRLAGHPAPELETLIKLYRVIILKLSVEANVAPELLKLVNDLIKPVLDWARLEEKRKEREFAEQRYRAQAAAQEASREKEKKDADGENALTPETLEKIERELKLF
jgi:hypothetical protein